MQHATIITGGGRGIGRALSIAMAKQAAVLVVGRTEADLVKTCALIAGAGGAAAYVVGDVANPLTAMRAMEGVKERGWIPRNIICNAGIGKSTSAIDLPLQQWQQVFDTNTTGAFLFAQAALPYLVEQQAGTICFVASIAGVKGYAYEAAYTASKHAMVGLAKSLAAEYGKHNISVVPICPSFVEGDMTERTIAGVSQRKNISRKEAREIVARTSSQRRIIPEEEVARVAEFICSGNVPSLSGSPIILNGGAL